jgi:hypothetical protein
MLHAVESALAEVFENAPLGSQIVLFPESPETERQRDAGGWSPTPPLATKEEGASPMVTYSRTDITALSNRLETRASVMSKEAGRDLLAAALLLRLMLEIAQVEKVETTVGGQRDDCTSSRRLQGKQ